MLTTVCAVALGTALGTALAPRLAVAQSTSPGPLLRSHARWDNQCAKCHEPSKGATDARCLDCHKEAKRSRYHWKMAQDSGKPCAKCHRDHQGRNFRAIRWKPKATFDHGKTGWRLQGSHAKVECKSCHKKPQRWMGESSTCSSCHKDPHKPTLGRDCASCHDERRFAPASRFFHDKARFRLRGAHKEVACASCHTSRGAEGRYRGLAFASCSSCHSDPVPKHSRGERCESCHVERSWQRVKAGSGLKLHGLLDFKLVGKHKKVDCADCHTPRRPAKLKRARSPEARLRLFTGLDDDCADCHKDPHRGRFGDACAKCHTPAGWKAKLAKRRGAFDHARTGFALRGRHRVVPCARCHAPSLPYKKRFTNIPHERCVDCHADVHPGNFASVTDQGDCTACHSESAFAPASFDLATHVKARFALVGAHRVVPCAGCHKPGPAERPKRSGRGIRARSPKRVAQLVGTDKTCEGCHTTPHGAQFDGRTPPANCLTCHTGEAFRPAAKFDHDTTRFKLAGPHKAAPCASCHTRPKAGAPVRFAGVASACATCHSDPHAGQFAVGGPKRTCDDCHKVVADFDIPRFDHDKTRFPLRGKHVQAKCASCHTAVRLQPEAKPVVHYRLGALACGRCHQNPHTGRRGAQASWLPGALGVFDGGPRGDASDDTAGAP